MKNDGKGNGGMEKTPPLTRLTQQDMQAVFDYIADEHGIKPEVLGAAGESDLGRIFELEDEFLVVMPPDLAFGMPKGPGVTVESLREELVRVVAYHLKLIE